MNETDSDLPKVYTPLILQQVDHSRPKVEYVVGRVFRSGVYAIITGPFLSVQEALETVPHAGQRARLIRLNRDGTEDHLYRWRAKEGCWKRVKK